MTLSDDSSQDTVRPLTEQAAKNWTAKLGGVFYAAKYPMPSVAMALEIEALMLAAIREAFSAGAQRWESALSRLQDEHDRLKEDARLLALEMVQAQQQLRYLWVTTGNCPCGARKGSEQTHPHITGCPTGAAMSPDRLLGVESAVLDSRDQETR